MTIREAKRLDLNKILQKDPAAISAGVVRRTYTGYKALCRYRYAHWFWERGLKKFALLLSYRCKRATGIDIHPAAQIGTGIFIDHGVGLVIGETTQIGNDCVLYQGVTLGGTGKEVGKRHPTLQDGVMVAAGAKVLGPVTIGANSKIGAGSVVLKDVPANCTVVGVPGRVVKQEGRRVEDMDQSHLPDPILDEIKALNSRLAELEGRIGICESKHSAMLDEEGLASASEEDGDENL